MSSCILSLWLYSNGLMTTALPELVSDKQKFPTEWSTQWCHVWRQSIYYLERKKNTQQKNKTSVALCQETCSTCLYILPDKDQMRQAMKWLTKSESYLRHPKAHVVNLRKLCGEPRSKKSKSLCGKKQMILSTSSLLSYSEKKKKKKGISEIQSPTKEQEPFQWCKKGLDRAPAFLKTRLANCLTLPLSKPSSHWTEIPFQYCYRADISTLVILGATFNHQQKLAGHQLPHLVFHNFVEKTNKTPTISCVQLSDSVCTSILYKITHWSLAGHDFGAGSLKHDRKNTLLQ